MTSPSRPDPPAATEGGDGLELFHPLIATWFRERIGTPTAVQTRAWPEIAAGRHVLVTAPTGSGKTLTAFLWAIDRLLTGAWHPGGVRVLYVSPLKALNNDIRRNLLAPLEQLQAAFAEAGEVAPAVRAATRSGDTTQAERRRMLRQPPEILITTPESLNILLTSKGGRRILDRIESVILDEIHAVAGSKRGTHLITAVERLTLLSGEFQRLALSATVRPLERIARFVGGWQMLEDTAEGAEPRYRPRPVAMVEGAGTKAYDLKVTFPPGATPPGEPGQPPGRPPGPASGLQGFRAPGAEARGDEAGDASDDEGLPTNLWEILSEDFKRHIRANRSTLLFANSRRLTEKITRYLNDGEAADLAYSHHGSLSREIRQVVEERLKDGRLAAIVATNSLELGIDIGALDEVLLVQAPPTIASAVQRIGRAGHGVGQVSRARLYPTYGRDFLDSAVIARCVMDGEIEEIRPVTGALDVLAQVILSMTVAETWDRDRLYHFLRSTDPYRELGRRAYELVLEMLAGRYADTRLRELKPRLRIDRIDDTLTARRGSDRLIYLSGGTIPDRGYYHLRLESTSAKIGELDEEFVWERSVGDTFTLGAQSWRIRGITHNDVLVSPARRGASMAPFWRAEERDRSFHLSCRIGELLERAEAILAHPATADSPGGGQQGLVEVLVEEHAMERSAAEQTAAFLTRQRAATGAGLPTRKHLVVEHVEGRRSDSLAARESGEREMILHTFWGGRVNRPFALALGAAWEERHGMPLQVLHDDDCVILQLPADRDPAGLAEEILSLVDPHRLEELLQRRLEATGFFGARFREAAGRALLLPRASFDRRVPLWLNRLRSKKLLEAVRRHGDFPLLLETWRTCLEDEMDLEALRRVLGELDAGEIRVTRVRTDQPSPFAANLVWKQTNRLMYEDDAPESAGGPGASLSGDLLRELVFSSRLRPRLPGDLIERFERKLQRTYPGYPPSEAEDVLDWIKERLLIPLEEWRRLLAARERDRAQEGEGFDARGLLGELAGKAVRVERGEGPGEPFVAAVESLPKVFRALDLAPDRADLRTLGGETEDRQARGTLEELLEGPQFEPLDGGDEDDPLTAFLGEWIRFYGPFRRDLLTETLGLAEARVRDALEALQEGERIVVDDFRQRADPEERSDEHLEICDAENLEILLRLLRSEARPTFESLELDQLPLFLATHQGVGQVVGRDLQDLRQAFDRLFGYPAPAAAWEEALLPARLDPYYTSWLDTLMQESELVWLGTGKEQLTFAFASDLELFREPEGADEDGGEDEGEDQEKDGEAGGRPSPDDLFPELPGKLSFEDLLEHSGLKPAELNDRLWQLAWEGRVSNSTFLAVRRGVLSRFQTPEETVRRAPARPPARGSRATPPTGRSRRRAFDRWRPARPSSDDWFRLDGVAGAPLEAAAELDALEREELNKDRVRQLLARYGVLFRQLLARELPALGWGSLFRTLRLMELGGEVVSGHFFRHLPGVQFCSPAALRTLRQGLSQDRIFWLNALDPASPCGLGLEAWKGELPPRLPSTHLVFHGPRRVVTSRRTGSELEIRVGPDHPHLAEYLEFLKVLLTRDFHPEQGIDLETINGEDAAKSPYARPIADLFQASREHQKIKLRRRY